MSLRMHVWMQACTCERKHAHTQWHRHSPPHRCLSAVLTRLWYPTCPSKHCNNKTTLSIIFNMIYVSGIIFKIILKNLLHFSWEVSFKFSTIFYLILKAIFPHPVHNCSMHTATQYSGQTLELCLSGSVNDDKINVFYFFTVSFSPANSAKDFTM